MKLLMVISGIQGPTFSGGIAKCNKNIVDFLYKKNNITIDILYSAHPYYDCHNYDYWKKYYKDKYNINFFSLQKYKTYGTDMMNRSYNILMFLKKNNFYDTILFNDYQGIGYYMCLAKKFYLILQNTKLIINIHGNHKLSNFFGKKTIKNYNEIITMFMEKKSIEYADLVISPSQYYIDWWKQYIDIKKYKIINNIVLKEIDDDIKLNPKRKKYSLCFFGRLEILKGLDFFINGILEMENNKNNDYKEIMNNIEINFIGNNILINGEKSESYIKRRCEKIINKINIIVNFNTKQAFEFMKENESVMILPTLGETSSLVVLESIINKIPFIASNTPGICELVDPEYHEKNLFICNNQESMISYISKFLKNPILAKSRIDQNEVINKWEEVLINFSENINFDNDNLIDIYSTNKIPLVSIIIPTYNRSDLFKYSIKSIINQNYNNKEIILVDDNSDIDHLQKKIEYINILKKEYPEINIIFYKSEKKLYKGAASNKGVELSNGKYITFFDDDDIAKVDMIQKYVKVLEKYNNIDILSCFADYFQDGDEETNVIHTSLSLGETLEINLISNFFGKGSFIIRKDKLIKINGYDEDTENLNMVDYRFYIKAAINNLNIKIIPESLYYYRVNKTSLFYNTNYLKLYEAKLKIWNKIKNNITKDIQEPLYMLYMNNSLPKLELYQVNEIFKWLKQSKNNIYISFEKKNYNIYFIILSSNHTKLCSIFIKNNFIIIKNNNNQYIFDIQLDQNLYKNDTYFKLKIINKILIIKNKLFNINSKIDLSSNKIINIRKIISNVDFIVF